MKTKRTSAVIRAVVALSLLVNTMMAEQVDSAKPQKKTKGRLKVFILAGQSNMEGHAKVETFDYICDDPVTAPLLKEMRGPDGKPVVCDNVWISYLTGSPEKGAIGEGFGKLTAGYGSRRNPTEYGGKIGPEFTFGITMGKAYDGPVLLIKTAWGGKSLNTDFRPPSAGPYEFNAAQLEGFTKKGKDGTMTKEQAKAFAAAYRAKLITPAEEAMWKRGASNAGYHYLGCAKTLALIGQSLATTILEMEKK